MRIYNLYKAFTGSVDAAVNVEIVVKCTIKQIQWTVAGLLNADGELYRVELAVVPTMQCRTHNSQGAISCVGEEAGFVTSGLNVSAVNLIVPVNYQLDPGSKLYLNGLLTGTANVEVGCMVWCH